MNNLNFLSEFGLNDIQIKIYRYLLNYQFGTIEKIKEDLDYSYAQVRENINLLEKQNFITSSEGKPKTYFRTNPKIVLTEILKKKNNKILEKINDLEQDLKTIESEKGICTRNITFYHHSDINIGLEYIYNLMGKTENEIILSSLPPSVLKKLERALYRAFLKGIKIKLYYSKLDFDSIENYFGQITDILKNINIEIIEISEKSCRFVRFNDLIVNEGVILIDYYFNSVLFIEDSCFHFNGFYMPNIAESVKKMFEAKTLLKSVEINPDPVQNVLDLIKHQPDIKTRELSIKSSIAGTKLREILEYLTDQGLIKEEKIKGEIGRPKKVYSIIE